MAALPILTTEMVIVMIIVVFAVFIFATELLRVGSAMTELFLVVSLLMLNLVFWIASYQFGSIDRIMRILNEPQKGIS